MLEGSKINLNYKCVLPVFPGMLKSINSQFYQVLDFGQSPGHNRVNYSSNI